MSTQRGNNGKSGGRQSTLFGLWSSNGRAAVQPESQVVAKRRRDPSMTPPPPTRLPPRLRLRTRWENLSLPNGPMLLLRGCIGGKKTSDRRSTRETLVALPHWNDNVTFKIYGKECRMRRRICQFSSDGEISYSYSGLKNVAAPVFPQIVRDIKRQVEDFICDHILEITKDGALPSKNLSIPPEFVEIVKLVKNGVDLYNYCLLNHYRDGEECMGYHADDESSLDPHTPIASVSLGITRHFDVRPVKKDGNNKKSRVARIALEDGDLLLMVPPMQDFYQHAVPAEKRITGERINLTFRRVVTS